jgi:hypothetical protein
MISQPDLPRPTLAPTDSKSPAVKIHFCQSNVGCDGAFVEDLIITRPLLPDRKCRYRSPRSGLNASSEVRFERGWPFGEAHP